MKQVELDKAAKIERDKQLQRNKWNEWIKKERQSQLNRIANAKEQNFIRRLKDPKRQKDLITRHAYPRRLNLNNINENNENKLDH
jgi:hypothetical protein